MARFDEAGVPAGRIRTMDQVYGWEQLDHLGLVDRVTHPTVGDLELPGRTGPMVPVGPSAGRAATDPGPAHRRAPAPRRLPAPRRIRARRPLSGTQTRRAAP